MDEKTVTPSAETKPVEVATPAPVAKKSKAPIIILVSIAVLCSLCLCCLVAMYAIFRNGDITLNGQCYKGIDNVFAGKPIPCQPAANTDASGKPQPTDNTNPNTPSTGTTTPAPTPVKPGTYANSEFSFTYPTAWKVDVQSDVVILTNPEGDTIRFSESVPETGSITETSCTEFAGQSLDSVMSEVDSTAELVNNEVSPVSVYDACIFDIDTTKGGTNHLRYVYIVDSGRGYLITLAATEDSTLQSDMLDVVDSYVLTLK